MTPPADTPESSNARAAPSRPSDAPTETPEGKGAFSGLASRLRLGRKRDPNDKKTGPDDADMFIAEVTEEMQRERLYGYLRRYGPYAIAAVVLMVGAAAFFEYRKSADLTQARAAGDALHLAAQADDPAEAYARTLSGLEGGAAMLAKFRAANAAIAAGDRETGLRLLQEIANAGDAPRRYTALADLLIVMSDIDDGDPGELLSRLEPMIAPGHPYRPMAMELMAVAQLRSGDVMGARRTLTDLLREQNVPSGVLSRGGRLLNAIGGPIIEEIEDARAPATPHPLLT